MEALREKLASQPPFMISMIPAALANKSSSEVISTIAQFTGIPPAKLTEAGILLAGKPTEEIATMIKSVMAGDDSLASALPPMDEEVQPEPTASEPLKLGDDVPPESMASEHPKLDDEERGLTAFDIFPVDRSQWVDVSDKLYYELRSEVEADLTRSFRLCKLSVSARKDDPMRHFRAFDSSKDYPKRIIKRGKDYIICEGQLPHAYVINIYKVADYIVLDYEYCVHKTQRAFPVKPIGAFPVEEKAQFRTEAHLKMLPLLKVAAKIE